MSRRHYLRAAVSTDEYRQICARADVEGLALAGYVRAALARDVERQSIAELMAAVRASLLARDTSAATATTESHLDVLKPTLIELLQLTRLVAAASNPQAAARITANVNQQYPNRSK